MSQTTERAMTGERLARFLQAWNDRDVDDVLTYFTDDPVFHNSIGPELLGETYAGRENVRAAIEHVYAIYPTARWEDAEVWIGDEGDRGAAEWTFVSREADGTETRVRGCDLFEFVGDRISVKNAFRKVRPTK